MANQTPTPAGAPATPAVPADTPLQLSGRVLRWLLAGHLSSVAAALAAFGAAVLFQQSADRTTSEVVGRSLPPKDAAALVKALNAASSNDTYLWLPTSFISWGLCLFGAAVITLILFAVTKGFRGVKKNWLLYSLVWSAAGMAGVAPVLGAVSNATLRLLGVWAPVAFLLPAFLLLVLSLVLSKDFWPALGRFVKQRFNAGSTPGSSSASAGGTSTTPSGTLPPPSGPSPTT
jgi:hypothetical protein